MKKKLLLLVIIIIGITKTYAQKVPEGIKYQAVARTATGEILSNHSITLRINLKASPSKGNQVFYSEDHVVTTNQFGLFDIVVGEGKNNMGVFAAIPWSSEEVWLAVSLKDKSADFSAITESRLLAVPYAFHALTASRLVDNTVVGKSDNLTLISANSGNGNGNFPGVPANVWSLQGNYNSNPISDKLGTTDIVDLVMVTSNIERLRIKANGDINIKRSLAIGANLAVDSSVYLNKVSGSTINYGPFKVDRLSPTLLSGTLTVDGATDLNTSLNVDGPTDLNSRLFVNNLSPTKLTGTLQVDGVTNLNSALSVNNLSATLLTGTLRVNLPALFKDTVLMDNTRASNSTSTGALVVAGGLGLGGNFNVGGASTFAGPVSFGSAVNITDLTQSTSTTTGALIVGGGVGIGKRLNVGEGGLFAGTLGVAGITSLTNTTESTATTNGALIVAGGAAIAKTLNVGAALNVAGATTINNTLQVNANANYAAQFNNASNANGVLIKIATSQANNNNNFVTFQDNAGNTVGRIEGQTLSELHNDPEYQLDLAGKSYDVISGAIDVSLASVNLAETIAFQIEADASVNACAGLGVVACPPIASFVAGSIAEVVIASVEEAAVIAEVVIASTDLGLWVTSKDNNIGVTYQSGAGDYAEFLMKQQPDEKIFAGDIVGVKGGKISKNIEGAEKVMVVSHKPIVLGNTPSDGSIANYEKVAFMGQVPVKVFGKVNLGDYIIPNGVNNGVGVAVAPDKIKSSDVKNIVGIAWSTADNALALSNVNVAIGLNVNDNQKLIEQQQTEIEELKNQIASTNSQLEKLIPGFKAPGNKMPATTAKYKMAGSKNTAVLVTPDNSPAILPNLGYPKLAANEVHYVEASRQDFEQGFAIAQDKMNANGDNVKYEKFWKKFKSDPTYKEFILNKLMKKYNEEVAHHKALDARLNN